MKWNVICSSYSRFLMLGLFLFFAPEVLVSTPQTKKIGKKREPNITVQPTTREILRAATLKKLKTPSSATHCGVSVETKALLKAQSITKIQQRRTELQQVENRIKPIQLAEHNIERTIQLVPIEWQNSHNFQKKKMSVAFLLN